MGWRRGWRPKPQLRWVQRTGLGPEPGSKPWFGTLIARLLSSFLQASGALAEPLGGFATLARWASR
ncbi:MAG: hypothetical protein CBARDMAM_2356 [uncultured Caballeronia sp.]|nr:MAG: hypothetical protein CBARDMAM_2356 [uncultured Caballeronia sp.]